MTKTGLKIIIKVDGFQDAKRWLERLVKAGVARCAACDKPAVQLWWNDAAEWYCNCGDHYESGPQWTGSTRWNPSVFDKIVMPDKARAWAATLDPKEQKCIHFREFDATDYYALLPEDHWKCKDVVIASGNAEHGTIIELYALTDGRFAFQVERRSPGYSYTDVLTAPFASRDEALAAAKKSIGKE